MTTIAIIGAGLSGLTVANKLRDYAAITLFEKSRGVGGRMATRRAEPYFFDHGAQFFTARTEAFKQFIDPMVSQGVIAQWDARCVEFDSRRIIKRYLLNQRHPYYVGVPGMNTVAKYLRQGLDIQFGTRVQSIKKYPGGWWLEDDQCKILGEYDWVVVTTPAPQTADLLPASLPFAADVSTVTMKGCFALMLGFETAPSLDFDVAFVRDENIRWLAANHSKPQRNEAFCVVVHSTNQWADEHMDDDRDQVMRYLCHHTSEITGCDLNSANHKVIHGWRYANIDEQVGPTHWIESKQNIAVCGDWLIKGSVEAAFTSGFDAANSLLKAITTEENS